MVMQKDIFIEVERVEDRKDLKAKDLKIFHIDCAGGKINFKYLDGDRCTVISCSRCAARRHIKADTVIAAFFKAAIKGTKTEFRDTDGKIVTIIQKV